MNDHTNDHNPRPSESYEPTREDVLIGRVVDSEASTQDWDELEHLAGTDTGVWARLGRAQKAHAGLRSAVEDAIAVAELIDLPEATRPRMPLGLRLTTYTGWVAAAALLMMILIPTSGVDRTGRNTLDQSASFANIPALLSRASPEEAYSQYVASGLVEGSVVGEMPTIVLEERAIPGEDVKEVFLVRRVVERHRMDRLPAFAVATDEHGRLAFVPAEALAPAIAPEPVERTAPATPEPNTPPNPLGDAF